MMTIEGVPVGARLCANALDVDKNEKLAHRVRSYRLVQRQAR
jgi:hypothetical protein